MSQILSPANPRHTTHGPLGGMPPTSHRPTPAPAQKPGRHNPNVPDIIPEPVPRETRIEDAPFVLADYGYPNSPPAPIALLTRGKIGQTVYQRTSNPNPTRYGAARRILIRRRMVVPADPRSDAQLQNRARFGRAVQLWKTLTDAQRREYAAKGADHSPPRTGLNMWLHFYAGLHPTAEFADLVDALRATTYVPPP